MAPKPSPPLFSSNSHLFGLRRASDLVREAERSRQEHPIPIRIAALDRLLGGGIRRGRLTEIFAPRSAGRFAAGLSTLAAATQAGESAALVDLADHLDPQIAEAAGVDLRRLLWIRPKTLKQAAYAAEMALAAGFALVVFDLGLPPLREKLSEVFWVRLARAAEASRGALLLLAPYHLAGSVADVSMRLSSARPIWRGQGLEPRLLAGLSSRAILEKRRGGASGGTGELFLRSEDDIAGIQTSSQAPSAFPLPLSGSFPAVARSHDPAIARTRPVAPPRDRVRCSSLA